MTQHWCMHKMPIRFPHLPGIQKVLQKAGALQAKLYLNKGEFAKAYEYYLEALHKYTMLHNNNGIASVYNGLGSTFIQQENYSRALQYFERSVGLYKEAENKTGLAISFLNIGIVHSQTNQLEKAEGYYLKALHLSEGTADKKIAIQIYSQAWYFIRRFTSI